jgi:hypothetical protein
MPFEKGHKKCAGAGMKKGQTITRSKTIKEAFDAAFQARGGIEALVKWAEKNETEFYKLASKLIPLDITSGGDKIGISIVYSPATPTPENTNKN